MEESEKKSYHFGEKLRDAREKKHMTLKSVAKLAGVSESLVSQIEHNKVSPAIDTLLNLASILDINLEYLFEEYSRQRPVTVIHKDERRKLNDEQILYEELSDSFSNDEQHNFESYIITIPAGSQTHRGKYGHIGKEMGLILQGSGTLHYADKTYDLSEGDSITFSAHEPHNIENTGSTPLRAMWIVTPAQKFNN